MSANFQDVPRRYHLTILDQCGLRSIDVRHDYRVAGDGRGKGRRQHSPHRPQLAAQRKLAVELTSLQLGSRVCQLTGSAEDADGNGEIETAAFLGQIGGGQVDGDAARWKLEIGVCEGRPHAILALLHHRLGQTNDVEGWESGADVDFDSHLRCIDSALFAAEYRGDAHPLSLEYRVG
jgi:hypothetical protein